MRYNINIDSTGPELVVRSILVEEHKRGLKVGRIGGVICIYAWLPWRYRRYLSMQHAGPLRHIIY